MEMITIGRFTEKLGNQLFQIAAAYTHAKENGVEFLCPEWSYQKYFKLKHKTYKGEPIQQFYSEPGFHYIPIPFKDNTALNGYFQSEKYFKNVQSIIDGSQIKLSDFDDRNEDIEWIFELGINGLQQFIDLRRFHLNNFRLANCSIHIRRGDYLNYPDHHPVCSLEYYNKAINLIHSKNTNLKVTSFIVFSDDIDWCKQNFKSSNNHTFYFSENNSDIIDLRAMTLCGNNIIANSTFSWWAAYLNKNPDKIVISPHKDQWHGPAYAHWNHDDLIPEGWIQITF